MSLLAAKAQDSLANTQKKDLLKIEKWHTNNFTIYGGMGWLGAHVTSVFYKNWGLGISADYFLPITKVVPDPYTGLFGIRDRLYVFSLNTIKKIPITKNTRLGTEIGISYVNAQIPNLVPSRGWLSLSNYDIVDYDMKQTIGLNLRASYDIKFRNNSGIEIGCIAQTNSIHTIIRPDIKLVIGSLKKSNNNVKL